ncbi:Solute carrier 26 [Rhizoclosmatium sp. JEL0117]|nr:Solute carrier 26 [Rhizoclosmatium sp. JEL0117]
MQAKSTRQALLAEAVSNHVPTFGSFSPAQSLIETVSQLVKETLSTAPLFPLKHQLRRGYTLKTFASDLTGAVTIAMIMLPQSIAYASLVHIPTVNCLISAVIPVLLYCVFGGSPTLSMGPEATISTITGAVVSLQMEANPSLTAVQVASSLSFLIGLIMIGLSALKAGFLDHILSGYLQTGFIVGAACLIITEQLPSVLGLTVKVNQDLSTIQQFIDVCKGLYTARYATILLSLSNILFLLCLKRIKKTYTAKLPWLKFFPEYLCLAIIMIAISAWANLGQYNITILGTFDNNIPTPAVPVLTIELFSNMFESAITVLLVGYIECMTVTRNFGQRGGGYVPSGNRELFAIGFTNLFASFFGCYPVFASLPRSRILVNCGARTTLSNAMAGILILVAFVSLKSVFQYIPKAMLSSIIIVSALGLIETKRIAFIFKTRAYHEILMLLATFLITLATSLSTGIILCLGLSAILIVRKTTSSNISIMGRLPRYTSPPTPQLEPADTASNLKVIPHVSHKHHRHHYVSIAEHPDALLLDGVLILRVDVPLMFYNCAQVRRSLEVVMNVEKKLLVQRRKAAAAASALSGRESSATVNPPVNGDIIVNVVDEGRWLVAGTGGGTSLRGFGTEPDEIEDDDDDDDEAGFNSEEEVGESVQPTQPTTKKPWLSNLFSHKHATEQQQHSALPSKSGSIRNGSTSLGRSKSTRATALKKSETGIGLYDAGGDVPINPSVLRHSGSNVASLKRGHDSDALIHERRERRRREGRIHAIIMDFKHCLEMDTAAAVVLVEILSTFLYDGIEVLLSGMHANQVVLLQKGDVHKLIVKYCTFCEDLEAAVDEAEKRQ